MKTFKDILLEELNKLYNDVVGRDVDINDINEITDGILERYRESEE